MNLPSMYSACILFAKVREIFPNIYRALAWFSIISELNNREIYLNSFYFETINFPTSRGVFSFAFTGLMTMGKETSVIDLIHKWRSIYNSFVEVQISLPSLHTIQ